MEVAAATKSVGGRGGGDGDGGQQELQNGFSARLASVEPSSDTMMVVDSPKLSLKVHEVAKDCQNQNGMRHGDYHQYRQYCTRRLKRVRSSRDVRFMFGKGKTFIQKVCGEHLEHNCDCHSVMSFDSGYVIL